MLLITNNTVGGLTARMLLPIIIVFSLLIGYYRLILQHLGWVGTESEIDFLVITSIFFYVLIILGLSYLLFQSDIKRIKAEKELRILNELVSQNEEKGKRADELIIAYRELKKIEELLVKSRNQVKTFSAHLNHVLEDERARIAREIHDEFGQQFAGIKIGLSLLKKSCIADKTTEGNINSMVQDVDHIIQSLRKIATELRPGILDTLGLVPSIEWLAKEFEAKRKIKCRLELNVKKNKFEERISTCFFRICQESLTNVSKHAKASEVLVSISQNNNELILKIADNGRGFSTENPEKPFSMGLIGMRERANIIDADLQIVSKKDLGTTVLLKTQVN